MCSVRTSAAKAPLNLRPHANVCDFILTTSFGINTNKTQSFCFFSFSPSSRPRDRPRVQPSQSRGLYQRWCCADSLVVEMDFSLLSDLCAISRTIPERDKK